MKIIFDNNVPAGLGRILSDHEVATCPQLGWTRVRNGDLLRQSEAAGFELMITADQNLEYQQNLSHRRIALIVLGSNRRSIVRAYSPIIVSGVHAAAPNSYLFVEMPEAQCTKKRWP